MISDHYRISSDSGDNCVTSPLEEVRRGLRAVHDNIFHITVAFLSMTSKGFPRLSIARFVRSAGPMSISRT